MSSESATLQRESKSFAMIKSGSQLREFLAQFNATTADSRLRCAIDTEADSLHSYQEKLCLIQFSCNGVHAIIDPLTIDAAEMAPLLHFLERSEVWMHGADFDMWMFRKAYEWIPPVVYDTQVAARLIGCTQFGLAHMVERYFGVVLPKGSQRADWGRRPLPEKMTEYAVNDVVYVVGLADKLLQQVRELGRVEWFEESCAAGRKNVEERRGPDPEQVWRIAGWGKLRPRGLAFLREIWGWRDKEAERMNRPPFKVIVNEQILALAEQLQDQGDAQLPKRFSEVQRRRYQRAIERARRLPENQLPKRRLQTRRDKPANLDEAVARLRERRDAIAESLNLDPTLIATRGMLEAIALDAGAGREQLMNWQRQLLMPE